MKAKLPKEDRSNAQNWGGKKETVQTRQAVVISDGEIVSPVEARFYMGRSSQASVVYCSVWVSSKGHYTSGHGTASGGGFDKFSAALEGALESAGVELYDSETGERERIAGRGDRAIREALEAITRACGYRGKVTIL